MSARDRRRSKECEQNSRNLVAREGSNPRPWCCSLAISRRTIGRLNVFHSRFYTNPRLQSRVLPAHSEMVTTLIAQMSDLLAPVSKSTTRPVPMGLCAVSHWCEGCRNKGKARLSSALDRISKRITLTFQVLPDHRKTTIHLIFQ